MTRDEHLQAIRNADHAYYDLDNPVMTDVEYDELRNDYLTRYGTADLDYVPGDTSPDLTEFKHPIPVTSLAKVKADVDPDKLRSELKRLWPVVHEPKLDGLTVVAYPDKAGRCTFVTRGRGGLVGEVLPNFIARYAGAGANRTGHAVRGEVFMDLPTFTAINAERGKAGLEPFANPRNAAAGILRNKERSAYLDRLRYVAYDVLGLDEVTEAARVELLRELTTFEVVSCTVAVDVETEMRAITELYAKLRHGDVPVDGIVVKSNQSWSLRTFGATDHHPRNAVAVKFEPTRATTTLRDVIWQVGRDTVTPVAIFDPVELDGSTVTKASLHNWATVRRLGLRLGDQVVIEKANEIIPQIVRNDGGGDRDVPRPTTCPSCGAVLTARPLGASATGVATEDQVELVCQNPLCDERLVRQIAYLGSKKVLDIAGLSIETARKLLADPVHGPSIKLVGPWYILDISMDGWLRLPGFAERSARALFKSAQLARTNVDVAHLVAACGVPGVGLTVGTALMHRFRSADEVIKILETGDVTELANIDGVGEVIAKTLCSTDFVAAYRELLKRITPTVYKPIGRGDDEERLTFVITGKLSRPRSAIQTDIEAAGHSVAGSVSSKTSYLVCEDAASTSTKAVKARKLGVKVIGEDELTLLLRKQ